MTDKRKVQDTYLAPAEKALTEDCRFWIDYTTDLAEMDPADTITASVWSVDGTVVNEDDGYTDQVTWIKVSGGTKIGTIHRLTNSVTTAQGDTLTRVLTIKIVNIPVKYPNIDEVIFTEPDPV